MRQFLSHMSPRMGALSIQKSPMPARRRGLSKSKLMSYRQCPKRLYLEVHGESQGLDMSNRDIDEMLARNGEDVGNVARILYGPGQLIGSAKTPLEQCLSDTQTALSSTKAPLFEATVEHDGVLIRADVLTRSRGKSAVVEVKSSTRNSYEKSEVKRETLQFDAAIQAWALERAGMPLRSVKLAMVNSQFVYPGDGNYEGLLHEEDVTEQVRHLEAAVTDIVQEARKTLNGKLPSVEMGPQCTSPYDCPFQDVCARPNQPAYPAHRLLTLRNRNNASLIASVEKNGWTELSEVPKKLLSHELDLRIWNAVKTGKPQLAPHARDWAKDLPFPRYYIDFETIQFAVPVWTGTRPYEQLPFQWSCHVEYEDGTLEHAEFVGDDGQLPLRAFAESLLRTLGRGTGPIVVYNQGFEVGRLRELAARFPDLAPRIKKVLSRIVDLLPVMRAHYYHRDMHGSWSIKAVLPTIAPDMDYDELDDVSEGAGAQIAYLKILDPSTPSKERQRLREALLRYCCHDTLAMLRIVQYLTP